MSAIKNETNTSNGYTHYERKIMKNTVNLLEIWQPHYLTNSVYIAKYKVQDGKNRIYFTKDAQLYGKVFEIDGEVIRRYPIVTNGKIDCYDVPMGELREIISQAG